MCAFYTAKYSIWSMAVSPAWSRHINIWQMNGWTWSEVCPTSRRAIKRTAKSFPECITTYNTLNNPGLKYTKGNGVWGRLMKNYQARMKASWALDLLHVLPSYYAIRTIIVFSTVKFVVLFVSNSLTYYYFPCIFLLYSFPWNFQ